MKSRRKTRGFVPHRITLWVAVLCVMAISFLDERPVSVNVEIPQGNAVELTRQAKSDVVVVLDYEAIAASGDTFESQDFSAAWINIFEQEIGPVTIATPGSLSAEILAQAKVLVLTHSASDMPEGLVKRLRELVLRDEILLVQERPRGELRQRFGANAKVGSQRAIGFTFARGLAEPYNRQLLATPLSTEFIGSTAARERATTLLSIDGAPVVYVEKIGDGHIITFEFDVGEALVSLQQGRPSSDFRIRSNGPPRTRDLVLDEGLRTSDVPYADLLERFIVFGVIGAYRPLPAFWLFPGGADGVVVALHPDDTLGDRATWMLRHETSQKGVSTLLTSYDAGLTAAEAATANRLGGEIGLVWKMENSPSQVMSSFGIGELRPFARPASLDVQFAQVVAASPNEAIFTAMVHGRWWTQDWVAPLRALVSKKIRMDASYSNGRTSGFGFGTGLPFLALDTSGLPLGIRELPVVIPTRTEGGPSVRALLELSQRGHHQALAWSLSPSAFSSLPKIEAFDAWIASFEDAKTFNHRVLSARRLDVFLRSRRAGGIQSSVLHDETSVTLRTTAEAKRSGMFLMVPAELQGRPFSVARQATNRVGDELVSGDIEVRRTNYVGFQMIMIPLRPGFNSVDVMYL